MPIKFVNYNTSRVSVESVIIRHKYIPFVPRDVSFNFN